MESVGIKSRTMAKRFTDTEKWQDEWWGSLPNDYRMIWLYLVDRCSIAGIWKKDFRGLNFNCNSNVTEEDFKKVFNGRLIDKGTFFFIPKFLLFQYPTGLNSDKPAIVSVRDQIYLNNLYQTIQESLPNGFLTIKDKDKDKVKGKVKEQDTDKGETFDQKFILAFDEITCERYKMTFKGLDLANELQEFRTKCDNDPLTYHHREWNSYRQTCRSLPHH